MTTARIRLTGIRADGRHGARPGEQDDAQPFVVDLELDVDVADDAIDETADYRSVSEAVREVIVGRSFDLIESIAAEIAGVVLAFPHVVRVTATVRKPNAAARLDIDDVSASVTAPE
jgi:dihydroneopterin aldolase/2-amino-4-hydroxy-6-hydroxymethyldihydropteridine diphosphokinase